MKKYVTAIIAFGASMVLCAGATQAISAVPLPSKKPFFARESVSDLPVPSHKPEVSKMSEKKQGDDAQVYAKIFELQARGQMNDADRWMKRLDDEVLLGHVLYQRYMHPTAYRSSFEELKYWLDLYADHPGASKIYKMAQKRKPSNFSGKIRKPVRSRGVHVARGLAVDGAKHYRSTKGRNAAQRAQFRQARGAIRRSISRGGPSYALNILNDNRGIMDAHEVSLFKSEIAKGYFYAGRYQKALVVAGDALKKSDKIVPEAAWVSGLVSWKNEHYSLAADHFKNAASSEYASGWMQAAASFWAARALMRSGHVREVSDWLEQAKDHPRTFYGLLAMRALGRKPDFNWKVPTFTGEYFDLLQETPNGKRAMALVSAKQNHLAEAELLSMDVDDKPELERALLAYANFANLPRLAMRLGNRLSDTKNERLYEAALYPRTDWEPTDGYMVDPALVHAIIHQESKFNPNARNAGSGASGLMQLMPATAKYTAKKYGYGLSNQKQLLNPQINLDIGQLYLRHLLDNPLVKGNVIKLLVAYNAGPGNLKRWRDNLEYADDPLLFIEMIPVAETRAYVERVLSNYWMYRMQDKKNIDSMDALAEGQWAFYPDMKKRSYTIAQR